MIYFCYNTQAGANITAEIKVSNIPAQITKCATREIIIEIDGRIYTKKSKIVFNF